MLAAAHAECGNFDRAVTQQKQAMSLPSSLPSLAALRERLTLFADKKPYYDPSIVQKRREILPPPRPSPG